MPSPVDACRDDAPHDRLADAVSEFLCLVARAGAGHFFFFFFLVGLIVNLSITAGEVCPARLVATTLAT